MNLAKDLQTVWDQPAAEWRSAPFWSWNSELDPERLTRQIESMHAAGMGGFFMHSRYGLKTPYLSEEWFTCISACIEAARRLGMKAYLYDEDRWPSGSAGGAVTRDNPEYRTQFIVLNDLEDEDPDADRVGLFACRLDDDGRLIEYQPIDEADDAPEGFLVKAFDAVAAPDNSWFNDGSYLDTMNPDAVAEFIHLTHQAYSDRYKKDFGELIPAMFTDEPNNASGPWGGGPGGVAMKWTGNLPREFVTRRGYDLRDHLPELAYPLAGEAFSTPRRDYHLTTAELFVESFSAQIGRWCQKHDLALTGHMLAEGSLRSQTAMDGSCMPHYEHMQWPGIDILTDQADELITAKQCTSVAAQLGKERVLSELYGCTGWDWPLEGHKFVGDWHLAVGVNFRCPHLSHYSLEGGAKRDYPASIRDHSPWWLYYRVVEDYFARLNYMLTRGQPVRDVLVIHPIETAWGYSAATNDEAVGPCDESLRRLTFLLSGQHYDWDFGDESILASHAGVSTDGLTVGEMTYRTVIVPPCRTLRESTVALLEKLTGGKANVMVVGDVPDLIDGREVEGGVGIADRLAGMHQVADDEAAVLAAMEALQPRRVSVTEHGCEGEADFIWSMHRDVRGGALLFVQSHDRRSARSLEMTVEGRAPVVLWDARTGGRHDVEATQNGDCVTFALDLPPTGSALLSLGLTGIETENAPRPGEPNESSELAGPFEVTLTEPNTLPLDYCRYRVGDEEFSELMPVLRAESLIRERYDLPSRQARGQQPWYLYKTDVLDMTVRDTVALQLPFHVTDLPEECRLAMERPGDFTVTVNQRPVAFSGSRTPVGTWVDNDIKTADIAPLLVEGENTVTLVVPYHPAIELEALRLVGGFATSCLDAGKRMPGRMTLVEMPRQLDLGDWCEQGLDFYGGAVRYRCSIDRPAGARVTLRLAEVACTAAVIHAGGEEYVLPWAPMEADITDALNDGENTVDIEIIGGRKNILGPLHVPWGSWTGPGQFDPGNRAWTDEYLLNPHGLLTAPVVEIRT